MRASEGSVVVAWLPGSECGVWVRRKRVGWANGLPQGMRWLWAVDTSPDRLSPLEQIFINFNTLVVRDGINPQAAHDAFLLIDEYAEHVSPDINGAK